MACDGEQPRRWKVSTDGVVSPLRRSPWTDRRVILGIALLAFVIRLLPLVHRGGLAFYGRYDDGVYYTAADALSFGRVPYRSFVLLHPPMIMLVLLPFALLGRLTTDIVGLETARIAFMGIGVVNTVLVSTIARRWSRTAMLIAGLMYACWYPAAYGEQSTILEPVGGLFVLVALWLLLRLDRAPTHRAEWAAGIALGFAVTTKIWYIAPATVIVGWQLLIRRRWSAVRVAAGGLSAVALVVIPFLIASHGRLYDMVVRDQLFRPHETTGRVGRITGMLGIKFFTRSNVGLEHALAAVVITILLVGIVAVLRDRPAWPVLALLTVDVGLLLESPVFFRHYVSLIAAPAALVVGIGLARVSRAPSLGRLGAVVPVAMSAILLGSGAEVAAAWAGWTFPSSAFKSVLPAGCISADDPIALVELDRLSSDLREGCRVPDDASGITFDSLHRPGPGDERTQRLHNPAWHRYLYRYLTRASAFVIVRPFHDGLTPAIQRKYEQFPLLADDDRLALRSGAGDPG